MGQIVLKGYSPKRHPNTLIEYNREVTYDEVEAFLENISNEKGLFENKSVFIHGLGSQPRSVYEQLKKTPGVRVVWYKSVLSGFFKPLSLFIASYAGLVKIVNNELLKDVFLRLSEKAMVGLYIFDASLETDFIGITQKKNQFEDVDYQAKEDRSYFVYYVDADNFEASTGIYEIISYGIEFPAALVAKLNLQS